MCRGKDNLFLKRCTEDSHFASVMHGGSLLQHLDCHISVPPATESHTSKAAPPNFSLDGLRASLIAWFSKYLFEHASSPQQERLTSTSQQRHRSMLDDSRAVTYRSMEDLHDETQS